MLKMYKYLILINLSLANNNRLIEKKKHFRVIGKRKKCFVETMSSYYWVWWVFFFFCCCCCCCTPFVNIVKTQRSISHTLAVGQLAEFFSFWWIFFRLTPILSSEVVLHKLRLEASVARPLVREWLTPSHFRKGNFT